MHGQAERRLDGPARGPFAGDLDPHDVAEEKRKVAEVPVEGKDLLDGPRDDDAFLDAGGRAAKTEHLGPSRSQRLRDFLEMRAWIEARDQVAGDEPCRRSANA